MKQLLVFTYFFLSASCGFTNEKSIASPEKGVLVFDSEEITFTVYVKDVEQDGVCPIVEVSTKDSSQQAQSVSLCEVDIPGYRAFHVLEDFAFIEFDNYRLSAQDTLSYDIDLAILQGSSFEVTCGVSVIKREILVNQCVKLK